MKSLKFIFSALPIIFFIGLVYFFMQGLNLNPQLLPSPLIDKPIPAFRLPDLFKPSEVVNESLFKGQVTLLNVWASWCSACIQEQPFLVDIANSKQVVLYGVNYKDNANNARAWLNKYGNPFKRIAMDVRGNFAVNLGVYGTPETFIVDKKGIVRYKQVGVITAKVWQQKMLPLIQKLQT